MSDLIKTSKQFLLGFTPPDYLVDGLFQRRYVYSLTGKTGSGKTAIGILVAGHVDTGRPLAGREVTKGQVIYFAGENPVDVQMRWLGQMQEMGIDPDTTDVHFIEGVVPLSQVSDSISAEITRKGLQPALVIVDTCAAYFEGDDDNNNVQMGGYARLLRDLTKLPGGPTVLILAHPTKRASDDDLVPKGGGAFLNEIDGNVGARRDGELVAIEVQGKFRGPEFNAIHFELKKVLHPDLKDTRSRLLPTVVAKALDGKAMEARETASDRDLDKLLRTIEIHPRKSRRDLAKVTGLGDSKIYRLAQKLENQKLIKPERNGWALTSAGQKTLNAQDSAGSVGEPLPPIPVRFPGVN